MYLKELNSTQRRDMYNKCLINDFHKSEVKPLSLIEELIKQGKYKCYGFYEDEDLLGYGYFIKSEDSIIMDYLAVDIKHRCKGLGSKFISLISEKFSSEYDTLLAEVENPKYALDQTDRFNRERRISFYIKNKFKISNIETCVLEDEYMIIKLKLLKELDDQQIKKEMTSVYKTIFGEEFFNNHINVSISLD